MIEKCNCCDREIDDGDQYRIDNNYPLCRICYEFEIDADRLRSRVAELEAENNRIESMLTNMGKVRDAIEFHGPEIIKYIESQSARIAKLEAALKALAVME